jgi:hypothetical protein
VHESLYLSKPLVGRLLGLFRPGKRRRAARRPAPARPALEALEQRDLMSAVSILDDGAPGYSTQGKWSHVIGQGYQNDYDLSAKGKGNDVAAWSFQVPAGQYRIAATWVPGSDRATDAPFTVLGSGKVVQTTNVNQEAAPSDFLDSGVGWTYLAKDILLGGGPLKVKLSDLANGSVVADAIRVERVSPGLSVSVEPSVGGAVVYEPVAPETAGGPAHGLLALRLGLTDIDDHALHVNDIEVSFPGQAAVPPHSYPVDVSLSVGGQQVWNFTRSDEIVLPAPAPAQVRLKVWADGYAAPFTLTMPLKPHVSPVAGGSYLFPAKASDLRLGEYWSASAGTHDTGYQGSQLFAYDMEVVAYDAASQQWSYLLPGTDGTKNSDFRIWGKPLYAMADGTVLEAVNNVPSNPHPLHWTSDADLQAQMKEQMDKYWGGFKNGGAGNHLYIQYGNEIVLVAHMQPGSIPAALLKPGAKVKAGQFLGLAGNSGNSTAPHTHIHAIQGSAPESGPLRPLSFHGIYVIDPSAVNPPSPAGPWVKDQGQALPLVNAQGTPALVWPVATAPTWYPPGWAEVARHGIPEASYQAEFDKIASSGYRPVWVDAYTVGGQTFFNVIFHPEDGTPWVARHGLTGAGYQAEFDKWTKQGYRLALVDSYLSGGGIRYAAIFVKAAGPQWTAYHGLTADQHQQQFDALTKLGYVPVNITAVEVGGVLSFAALYEKRDVGSFVAQAFLTPADYQQQFDANAKAGRRLVYLNAYTYNGGPRFVAIWEQKAPAVVAHHGMTSSGYQAEFDAELAKGLLVRDVAGYEEGGQARFAAFWTK